MPCGPSRFPDPADAPGDTPLAIGSDLRPETLLDAYRHGIFPWPTGEGGRASMWWWSPDPRAVFWPQGVHVSRSLQRTLRSQRFTTTIDQAFEAVVIACADRGEEGTWITPEIIEAYTRLHALGHAHSVEVWNADRQLVGGIYGVAIGAAFCGESKFHRATDASKVALISLTDHLWRRGFAFLDAQLPTGHLASLGAATISRRAYLEALHAAVKVDVTW